MSDTVISNLIVGAGPAGLATAGRLRHAGMEFTVVEQSDRVGIRWHHHYDRLHLHSVKRLSHLPHLPFPKHFPVYVPRKQFAEYLDQYARHFDIAPLFGREVKHIQRKNGPGIWEVSTTQETFHAKNVILATGVNRIPFRPHWEGEEIYSGRIVHSVDYRNPLPFKDSNVLVIGMGNTGAEIALDLAESGIPVSISVRRPVNIVPRDLNGRPVQETARILALLPFGLGDWIGAKVQRIYFGNLQKYGLKQSRIPPAVELRTLAQTPVIDIGTVKAIKQGKIGIVGDVKRFTSNSVILADGATLACDAVILATGYRSCLDAMIDGIKAFYDQHGYPLGPIGTGEFAGLYFVGFDDYQLGGILGGIQTDSKTVVDHLRTMQ